MRWRDGALAGLVALAACNGRTLTGDGSGSSDTGESETGECTPEPEVCDGVDNDCDGLVDEDIAPVTCGAGGCATTVYCEDGAMAPCEPGEPMPESCNLADDDCDGEVDEGLGFGPKGEPILLRSDEGETGDCTSCRWAWGTALAPTSEGFLALWNVGLNGSDPNPTLFGRTTDIAGKPTGPVELLRDDLIIDQYPMPALSPYPAGGLPLAAIHRAQDDVSALLFGADDGSTDLVSPIPGRGPHNVERTVWTGNRFVTTWEEDDEVRVAVLLPTGEMEKMVDVDPLVRTARGTLGLYPGRVGLMVSRVDAEPELNDMWFIGLDSFGTVVTPAHEVDVEYSTWQRLIGTEEGWLHLRPVGYQVPSTRQRLDLDGDPVDQPIPFEDGRSIDDSGLTDTFVARPGLHEMIAAWGADGIMHVEFLDDRGDVLRGWSGELDMDPSYDQGYLVEPHVQFVGERVLIIWHGLADDQGSNPVYVREFGCVE